MNGQTDFVDSFTESQKRELLEGMNEADAGEVVDFECFMKKHRGKPYQEAEKAGIHDVEFSFGYFFAVEFKRMTSSEKSSPKSSLKGSLKIISKELNESQLALFNLISDNPGIRTNMISELLSRSVNTLEKQIKILISKELIERKGGKKTGGYFIKNNNNTDIKETIVAD